MPPFVWLAVVVLHWLQATDRASVAHATASGRRGACPAHVSLAAHAVHHYGHTFVRRMALSINYTVPMWNERRIAAWWYSIGHYILACSHMRGGNHTDSDQCFSATSKSQVKCSRAGARPNTHVERDRFAYEILGILTVFSCARGGSRAGRWAAKLIQPLNLHIEKNDKTLYTDRKRVCPITCCQRDEISQS
jgi:hypothetical protein